MSLDTALTSLFAAVMASGVVMKGLPPIIYTVPDRWAELAAAFNCARMALP